MNSPLRGVNLGGWLVLEKWMTPSVFAHTKAINEYELAKTPQGVRRIEHHHETFIQEADFLYMKKAGIEIVRVPVGFWVLHGYYRYVSARRQLDWVFEMAQKYEIRVLLCLHAAPGPQNSNDHSGSGRPGVTRWYDSENKAMTRHVLEELAQRYAHQPSLWGIELLNEPTIQTAAQYWQLWWWTRWTGRALKKRLPASVRIIASDCYQSRFWSGRIGKNTLDVHHYQCFSAQDISKKTYTEHHEALLDASTKYARYRRQQPIIIGEWSGTLPDAVRNGETVREFVHDQSNTVLSESDAWFFWSYKTESSGSWNFRWLYEKGYFDNIL